MGKKLIWLVIVSICFAGIHTEVWAANNGMESEKTELLVLIDNSGSIQENKQQKTEQRWVENICAHARASEITLNFMWFDDNNARDEPKEYSDRIINCNDISECIETLNTDLKYDGDNTDFNAAMQDAIAYFEKTKEVQNKYILILTDGEFAPCRDFDIEKEKEEFIGKLNDFIDNGEDGTRGIILTGLGADNHMAQIMQSIQSGQSEQSEVDDDSVIYVPIGKEIISAVRQCFNMMGIPIKSESESVTRGDQVSFTITETCSRAIVYIQNKDDVCWQDVEIDAFFGGKKTVIDDMSMLTHSVYLYFKNPATGDYTISLPEGEYKYNIEYQKVYELEKVGFLIVDENDKEKEFAEISNGGKEKLKKYIIGEDDYKMGMQLEADGSIETNDIRVYYKCESIENDDLDRVRSDEEVDLMKGYKRCSVQRQEGDLIVLSTQPALEKGMNELTLQVVSGETTYFSNKIIIEIEEEADTKLYKRECEVGEKYALSDIAADIENSDGTLYMKIKNRKADDVTEPIKGERFLIQEVNEESVDISNNFYTVEYDAEKKSVYICFKRNGEYTTVIQNKDNSIEKNVIFCVSGEEKTEGFWENLMAVIKKFLDSLGLV